MFDQILLSPQVKQSVIISNKHGTCEFPQELLSDLRKNIWGTYEESLRSSWNYSPALSLPSKIKKLFKKHLKIEMEIFPHCATSHEN